jgi:carbon-monoxide dehydrogenase medium subunit
MYPKQFEYLAPRTVQEAVSLLSRYGEDARVLAGGQSLLPLMKLRMSSPQVLIDINGVAGLSGIREQDGMLVFGALTRHAEIEESALVKARLPIMHDAASVIGDVQVRNWGTIGGALTHADPAGDWSPTLLAVNGSVKCVGPRGERTIAVEELEVGAYTTSLAPDEVVTEVRVPLPSRRSGGAYLKFERKAGDFAVASAAVQVTLDDKKDVCQALIVALGAVGLTAVRAREAEAILTGAPAGDTGRLQAAVEAVEGLAEGADDTKGTAEYKRHLIGVLFRRAFAAAVGRARGEEARGGHV